MSRRLRTLALLTLGLAALGTGTALATRWLDGPLGMIPGGRLAGPSAPCPTPDWSGHVGFRELELEVRPERPRSVRTWGVVHDGSLFVPADFLMPWKRWPGQVEADPRVRVRIDGRIYACSARRVEDPRLVSTLRARIGAKYAIAPDARAARVEVVWFGIGPRS